MKLRPVKAYTVRFEPASRACYLVFISKAEEASQQVSATIVSINPGMPTPDIAHSHWNRSSDYGLDSLRKEVERELCDLNGRKTLILSDERWTEGRS